jgi:hypothetical protein
MEIGAAAPSARRAAIVITLIGLAALAAPVAQANAQVLATEPYGASSPVLWNGGVAWWGEAGIRFAAAGSSPRVLAPFPEYGGINYYRVLDGGSGAGAAGGPLAYGWNEVNSYTPPMGPGDTNVPSPPIPYETAILKRGVIATNGVGAEVPECAVTFALQPPSQLVSLAGSSIAYGCTEPGPAVNSFLPYVALANASAPAATPSKVTGLNGPFQISGSFIAYQSGEPLKAGTLVVKNLATNTVAYQAPQVPGLATEEIALQEDGSLLLLGQGTPACPQARNPFRQTYPAEWFPVASPVAHQLGCFYDGALRPVGGKWVALAPGPGRQASLVLVELATGARTTLAVFPDPGIFESHQLPLTPAADFDGTRLAWVQETCTGAEVQLTPDVHTMSPGAPTSEICPVQLHIHGALRARPTGNVRVAVSCPQGCRDVFLGIRRPRALSNEFAGFFSLPPTSTPVVESFHLSRDERAYLRKHRRVRITLVAELERLGEGPGNLAKYKTQATLVR